MIKHWFSPPSFGKLTRVDNRRIGARLRVHQLELDWMPTVPRKGFRKDRVQRAVVVDLSLTGALVTAKADRRIVPGTKVDIGTVAGRGVAGVRRIEPVGVGVARYGIAFLSLEPALQQLVNDTVAAHNPDDIARRWNQAP